MVQEKILESKRRLESAEDEREKMLAEREYNNYIRIIEEQNKALATFIPKRITILTDRKFAQSRFAFIHFSTAIAAQAFARIKETTKIVDACSFMHALYQGEFKRK